MRMEDSRLPKQIFSSQLARGTRRQGGQTKHYKTPSRTLCAPVTSRLKAGSILQQIATLGGWQLTTEPKPRRKGDCHSLTSNAEPGKSGRPSQERAEGQARKEERKAKPGKSRRPSQERAEGQASCCRSLPGVWTHLPLGV